MTRSLWLNSIFAGFVLLIATASSNASDRIQPCNRFWRSLGHVTESRNQIMRANAIPELAEPVAGMTILTIRKGDGARFVPGNLNESSCYLRRVLPKKVSHALELAAMDAIKELNHPADTSDVERLFELADARLDSVIPDAGGIAVSRLREYLENDYQFVRWDDSAASPLQRLIRDRGPCSVNMQMTYVLLAYVSSMGIPEFDPSNFSGYFRSEPC